CRVVFTGVILALIAIAAYQFNLFQLELALIPFYLNLLLFGWALGLVSVSLILRFGHGAESLAWAVPFMVQPFSAVFYPVSALPGWLQPVAHALPSTHVFEGMRQVIEFGTFPMTQMVSALLANILFLGAALLLLHGMLTSARRRGFLVKVTSS
ncbi:MAG TPA: ABC transporter, partial [Verrucomicrobiales bacterium]|nr:ABC transporter [Verrucomicrobiales bacterium]